MKSVEFVVLVVFFELLACSMLKDIPIKKNIRPIIAGIHNAKIRDPCHAK